MLSSKSVDTSSFIQSCSNLGSPLNHLQAESTLLSLRSSPLGIDLALTILGQDEHSELVLYHASMLLRDAAIRQFNPSRCSLLVQECLKLALSKSSLRAADSLLQSCAALYKRAFLIHSAYLICPLTGATNQNLTQIGCSLLKNPQFEWHGARILLHLVWEFSFFTGRTTALGQTLDFHLNCGKVFVNHHLQNLFISTAQRFFGGSPSSSHSFVITLLEVLDATLNWPFDLFQSDTTLSYSEQQQRRNVSKSNSRICPGASWSFLLQEAFLQSLISQLDFHCKNQEITRRIFQVCVSLCCLSGDVFGEEESSSDALQSQHATRMCQVGFYIANKHSLVDGTFIVCQALSIPKFSLIRNLDSVFPTFISLSQHVISKSSMDDEDEAKRALLTVWVLLLSPSSSSSTPLSLVLVQGALEVFIAFVKAEFLAIQNVSFDKEEEEEEEDSYYQDLACLARLSLNESLSFLLSILPSVNSPSFSFDVRCESVSILAELLSAVLTYPDLGEMPSLPPVVLECQSDLPERASEALVHIFTQESSRIHLVSPFLSASLLRTLRSWQASFLFSPRMSPSFSMSVMQSLLQNTLVHLTHFAEQEDVGTACIHMLESLLLKRDEVSNEPVIRLCPAWKELVSALLSSLNDAHFKPLHQVNAEVHGDVLRLVSGSCAGGREFSTEIQSVLEQRLTLLAQMDEASLIHLVELYAGLSKTQIEDRDDLSLSIRESVVSKLALFVDQVKRFRSEAVLLRVLHLFSVFSQHQLSVVEAHFLPSIFASCHQLVQIFVEMHAQVDTTSSLAELVEFRAESLNSVLKLLNGLSDRNYIDFSSSSSFQDVVQEDPSNLVLVCIQAILPLVTVEMFQLAEVVNSFFQLVAGMCRSRPEHVGELPSSLFYSINQSLAFGVRHHDPTIHRTCVESLASLATSHFQHGTLALLLIDFPTLFGEWLVLLLDLMVTAHELIGSTLDVVASTVLTIAKCDFQAFTWAVSMVCQRVGTQKQEGLLIDPESENQRLEILQQVLQTEFNKLFQGVRLQGGDRSDRKLFSSNVHAFVKQVRGYVLIK